METLFKRFSGLIVPIILAILALFLLQLFTWLLHLRKARPSEIEDLSCTLQPSLMTMNQNTCP